MASVIKAGNATDGVQVTSDNTGILELKTGTGAGTTAVTIGTDQSVTFAGAISSSGNQTVTGNLTVDGNTTLGNANTDTILMTAAPSIGGAGLGMGFGFRNRIINGAMVIDQRNAGASVTPAHEQYTLDRWVTIVSQTSKISIQRNAGSVTPPAGFSNYLGVTSLSAYSIVSGDYFGVVTRIEGFNGADLAWGTASASPVTISFWVRSSLTGVFGGSFWSGSRNYVFTYSISAANTWEYKTVTVAGDTSGTYQSGSALFTELRFGFGSGASFSGTAGSWGTSNLVQPTGNTSVVGTNGATWYITGVQLEKGSTATAFDYRPYTTELQLCQRYAIVYGRDQTYNEIGGTGWAFSTTQIDIPVAVPVQMRSTPTVSTSGSFQASDGAAATAITSISIITTQSSSLIASLRGVVASGLTTYRPYRIETNNSTTANVLFSAEL